MGSVAVALAQRKLQTSHGGVPARNRIKTEACGLPGTSRRVQQASGFKCGATPGRCFAMTSLKFMLVLQ